MAKNGKAAKAATSETTSEPTNGGLVFERLGKDYEIPTVQKGSMWEETLGELAKIPGEPVVVFKGPYEKARKAYNRAKALKKQAELMKLTVNCVVRKQGNEAHIIASVEA